MMEKIFKFVISYYLLILIAFFLVIITVACIQKTNGSDYPAENITLEKVIEYLDESEKSHQDVLDDPERIEGIDKNIIGDLEFHAECVKRYSAIKKFILENCKQ